MAPRPVPPEPALLELADRSAWEAWLAQNYASDAAVWVRFAKKGAPHRTVTQAQAIEVALCFGWIDGQLGRVDEYFYRQRFSHRRARSKWSRINRDRATELIAAGLMRPPGLEEVKRAQADGRWAAAYEPQSAITVPADFQVALDANPPAAEFFATLTGANRYAFLYRIGDAKRPETRARRIAQYTEMLEQGRTLH
jgi:uncharacterized protein YdeI (YjbR/CyaY-like superfamily)